MSSRTTLGLLLVSMIWGTTFVAVKVALTDSSPLLFVGLRFALAALAALPVFVLASRDRCASRSRPASRDPRTSPDPHTSRDRGASDPARARRASLLAGLPLGVVLAAAYTSQTFGLTRTTPARSAFVTGLNVALVPLWGWLLTRRWPGRFAMLGLALTLPGLWILTTPQGGSWNRGDSWTLLCAVLYALYLVLVTRFGREHDPAALLLSQLAVTSALCLVASPILEHTRLNLTWRLAGILVFIAGAATTLTTWLQVKLQPNAGSARSAVIFATEPVFAALFSEIVIGERLTATAWLGGGIILAGMLLSEIGSAAAGHLPME